MAVERLVQGRGALAWSQWPSAWFGILKRLNDLRPFPERPILRSTCGAEAPFTGEHGAPTLTEADDGKGWPEKDLPIDRSGRLYSGGKLD